MNNHTTDQLPIGTIELPLADYLPTVPTHVLRLRVAAPVATLYLPLVCLSSCNPPLSVGALYYLYVDGGDKFAPPSRRADDDILSKSTPAVRYLVRLQALLPSHRLQLHPLSSTDSETAPTKLTPAAVCPVLHAQLSHVPRTPTSPAFRLRTAQVEYTTLIPATRVVLQPHNPPSLPSPAQLPALAPSARSQTAMSLDGCAVTLSSLISTDYYNHIQLYSILDIEPSQHSHTTAYTISSRTSVEVCVAQSSSVSSFPTPAAWLARVKQQVCGYDATVETMVTTMHRALASPSSSLAALYPAPRVFLLHGLPGTGKSLLVEQLCQHSTLPCLHLSAADLYQKVEGEGEERIEATFAEAKRHARVRGGACLVVDDVDTICHEEKDEAGQDSESGGLERALVASLCRELDELHFSSPSLPIFVFFTTSRITRVSSSLLRQGRIDRKVHLPALSPQDRLDVLRHYSRRMTLMEAVDEHPRAKLLQRVSDRMHGYVAADVEKLCGEVSIAALTRASKSAEPVTRLTVSEADFLSALQTMRPANLSDLEYRLPKDISATASSASPFADLAGLDDTIKQLQTAIIAPLLASLSSSPSAISSALPLPSGLLLYGATGVGKTSLALALALSSTLPPLIIQSTSLVSSIVGQTEKNITALFNKARASAPCLLLLDQLDNIGQRRGGGGGGADEGGEGGGSYERMVACLLQELDGIGRGRRATTGGASSGVSQPPVFVIATSSHPELLDPALLRPGRLDYHCHIPAPTQQVRQAIVRHWLQRMPVGDESAVGGREALVAELAARLEGGSGADVAGVMREAALRALRRGKHDMDSVRAVEVSDFLFSASEMRPSLKGLEETHPAGDRSLLRAQH